MNLHSFTASIMARRWLTVLLSLVLVAALAAGAQFIVPVDVDFRNHFNKDDPHLVALDRLEDTYAISDTAFVAVAPKDGPVFTREALVAVEELTGRLWRTPYVTRVDSIANYSHSEGRRATSSIVEPLIDDAASLGAEDLKRIEEDRALHRGGRSGRLVARDGRVAGLVVSVALPDEPERRQAGKAGGHVDFLHGVAAEAREKHSTLDYHMTGEIALNRAMRDAIDNEMGDSRDPPRSGRCCSSP